MASTSGLPAIINIQLRSEVPLSRLELVFAMQQNADCLRGRRATTQTQRLGPVRRGCVMQRRRFKQTLALEERLAEEGERLREQAKKLPPGLERETLLRKARQAETGSHISEWPRSPGAPAAGIIPLI